MVDETMEINPFLEQGKDLKFLDIAKGKGRCQVKLCPKWDCSGHWAATAHKAAPHAVTAPGTLLPSALPGCCLTYQDLKRF